MIKRQRSAATFAETAVESRIEPDEWLLKLRDTLDWKPLERKLEKLYADGVGRPAYPPLALFRVMLLQRWYNLSDPEASRQLRYNLLFQAFAGLSVEDAPPDDTTIALFRKRLMEGGVEEWAFAFFLRQMERRGLVVKTVTLGEATVVEAIHIACRDRMRPIMLTSLTTMAGLAPMALGVSGYSKIWSPFATCMCWGLAVATVLTLCVVPAFYLILEDAKRFVSGMFRRTEVATAPADATGST